MSNCVIENFIGKTQNTTPNMNIAIEKTSNCRYILAYIMYGATFMCACVHLYVVNVCVYIVCEMRVVHACTL